MIANCKVKPLYTALDVLRKPRGHNHSRGLNQNEVTAARLCKTLPHPLKWAFAPASRPADSFYQVLPALPEPLLRFRHGRCEVVHG